MHSPILLLCLVGSAFCYYEQRTQYYEAPYVREQRYREQRITQNKGQQQPNLFNYESERVLHQQNRVQQQPSVINYESERLQQQQNKGQQQPIVYTYENERLQKQQQNRGQQQQQQQLYDAAVYSSNARSQENRGQELRGQQQQIGGQQPVYDFNTNAQSQDRNQKLINYYGYHNAQVLKNRGQQKLDDYESVARYREQQPQLQSSQGMSENEIASVLHLIQTVTDQMRQEALRTGETVEIRVHADNDIPISEIDIQNEMAKNPHVTDSSPTPIMLRDGDTTLKLAGIDELIIPGSGPVVQLSLEGPLADMVSNTKMSQLSIPQQLKQEMLSGAYQEKLKAMHTLRSRNQH